MSTITKITVKVIRDTKPPYGTITSVEITSGRPTDKVRGVEALAVLNDAMQQIIEQMK
ncbi:hypothetical protein [Spirosoma sp.]|uniref:hypothetical protein n=1 Tax=Spirosoma sp. TaxID=1899569 RepID=UPI00261EAE42|nr:hypothetical protein [Spirosoma sp.]MCX6217678.1 hypothetical protein [Spirosoma sp.]